MIPISLKHFRTLVLLRFISKILYLHLPSASTKTPFFRHSQLDWESQRLDNEIPTFVGMTLNVEKQEFPC
jgi:hypothetical protein